MLRSSGRVQPSAPGPAELLVAQDGQGLDARGARTAALVLPPADEALLPAVNRRLADAGIPWQYEPRTASGGAELAGASVARARFGEPARSSGSIWCPPRRQPRPRVRSRRPPALPGRWKARTPRIAATCSSRPRCWRRPTTLPVSTGMVRFLDWVASEWAGAGGESPSTTRGRSLPAPAAATRVRFPSGREVEIDGTRTVRGTGEAGLYTFLAADTTVAVLALNPPFDRVEARAASTGTTASPRSARA